VALDLGEEVREMADILKVSISKKVALSFDFADDLAAAEADPAQMRQVILNLIVNASEAIGDREGTITVRTGMADADRAYLDRSLPGEQLSAGRYVYLEVADTGCGMRPEILERIFDPFFTTKFAGRGLGLAVVLGIVRRHRGAVRVDSEPGKGTTFRVLLPIAQRAPKAGRSPSGGEPRWRGQGTVLLADDEEQVLRLGARMLEQLGFRVLTAPDGRAALELLERCGQELALAVLDLTMPRLDGGETLRALRRLRPELPVLLASGYDEQVASRSIEGDRLTGFLQKPYDLSQLAEKVRNLLESQV
jgi:CheY-like chemotaxis protein